MRNAELIFTGYFVGADVESTVYRGRVAVDDLAVEAAGQRERQRTLPARGWSEYGNDDRFRH
jgi:hypothetical protein